MDTAWTNELSIGNAVIDSEHQNLIVMIVRIEAMINFAAESTASLYLQLFGTPTP